MTDYMTKFKEAAKKVDFENIEFGILRNRDILDKNLESMSTDEIVIVFANMDPNYDKIIAYIFEKRPDVFEKFERQHLRMRTRAMVKGLKYLLERKDIEGISDDRLAEILYDIAEPDDLEVLMSLPDDIRKKLDDLIAYHRDYDDWYDWKWEYSFLERKELGE